MPELPEVEIVKQSLNKSITGKIIKDILIKNIQIFLDHYKLTLIC